MVVINLTHGVRKLVLMLILVIVRLMIYLMILMLLLVVLGLLLLLVLIVALVLGVVLPIVTTMFVVLCMKVLSLLLLHNLAQPMSVPIFQALLSQKLFPCLIAIIFP